MSPSVWDVSRPPFPGACAGSVLVRGSPRVQLAPAGLSHGQEESWCTAPRLCRGAGPPHPGEARLEPSKPRGWAELGEEPVLVAPHPAAPSEPLAPTAPGMLLASTTLLTLAVSFRCKQPNKLFSGRQTQVWVQRCWGRGLGPVQQGSPERSSRRLSTPLTPAQGCVDTMPLLCKHQGCSVPATVLRRCGCCLRVQDGFWPCITRARSAQTPGPAPRQPRAPGEASSWSCPIAPSPLLPSAAARRTQTSPEQED